MDPEVRHGADGYGSVHHHSDHKASVHLGSSGATRVSSHPDTSDHQRTERHAGHRAKEVPEVGHHHHRYFENPFPDFYNQPLRESGELYLEDALGLLHKIYRSYSIDKSGSMDADIYTGAAGVAYACDKIARLRLKPADEQMAVDLASRLVDSAVASKIRSEGFLVGTPGVFVVGALVYSSIGEEDKAERCIETFAKFCQDVGSLKHHQSSGDEVFSGRAGYLAGFLALWKAFPNHKELRKIDVRGIVESILVSGRHYSKQQKMHHDCPLYFYHFGSDYLGAAHGISSILQLLLSFPQQLAELESAMEDVKKSVEYVMKQQDSHGNFPPQFGEQNDGDQLVHWCHGAPGVIHMLAKGYLTWKEARYLEAATRSADFIWKKGLLRKGPGICHGIAGNGYAFLVMYRLTGELEYLYRAQCFADVMFQKKVQEYSRTPDNAYSLFEGVAGTICFLIDLTDPKHASFPFFDIFTDYHSHI